jgi:hypothetical protein
MTPFEGTIFMVWLVPDRWPPDGIVTVLRQIRDGGTVIVTVDSAGRFSLDTTAAFGELKYVQFQPVKIEPRCRILLRFGWGASGLTFGINGRSLTPASAGEIDLVVIPSNEKHRAPAPVLIYPNIQPEKTMREVDKLFLETLGDLDAKVMRASSYDLIRAGGLLRQLLLDPPLVHDVNRFYRRQLKFSVLDHRNEPPSQPAEHWRCIDPLYFPGVKTLEVDLDGFLAAPILRVGAVTASVKDVIRACANAKGGVHYGAAADAREQLLLSWDDRSQFFSAVVPSLESIAGLCRVVLVGLRPLVSAIEAASAA